MKPLAFVLVIVIVLTSVIFISQIPVHRVDIMHSDIQSDVTNSDIDIVEISSFLQVTNIILQMKVAGVIVLNDSFRYKLKIVAKYLDDPSAHIYTCSFINGVEENYGFDTIVDNILCIFNFQSAVFSLDHS